MEYRDLDGKEGIDTEYIRNDFREVFLGYDVSEQYKTISGG